MASKFRIAFLGFSEFERNSLSSYFRLAANRELRYEQVPTLTDADFLVADADDAPSVQLILATERVRETVFIGSAAPPGAVAWMRRPIDALHVMRQLDTMAARILEHAETEAAPLAVAPPSVAPAVLPSMPPLMPPSMPPSMRRKTAAAAPPASSSAEDPGAASETLLERAAAALPEPVQPPPAPRAARTSAAARPPSAPALAAPAAAAPPARALLVDDSAIALRFLEAHLQPWGLLTDRAQDSEAALELLLRHSYDFVFLDVELGPGSALDGLGLCQHIKQSAAAMHANVVMVSAHHSELDRVRGALAGCDAYLGKPLDSAELVRLLKRHGLKVPRALPRDAAPATN